MAMPNIGAQEIRQLACMEAVWEPTETYGKFDDETMNTAMYADTSR